MSRLRPRPGRRVLAGAALAVALAAAAVAIVDPFGGSAPARAGVDNGAPTGIATIERQDLSSQTQVSATLGYADPSVVSLPSGTAPSSVQQAEQAADSARSSLRSASQTLAADDATAAQAQSTLDADRLKLAVDCGGAGAAESGGGSTGGGGGSTPACPADTQAVATDRQALTAATSKVQADADAVASARTSLGGAETSLAAAEVSATPYAQSAVYTMLPAVGRVIGRGQALFAVAGVPVVLLYGGVTAWRAFVPGMSPGSDVAELNANLRALGYGRPAGDAFSSETEAAIEALQSAHGVPATGRLLLGSVVFEPGAVRVTSVTPTVGAPVQGGAGAGTALGVTSTRRVVTIALDASAQTSVKVGDPVTITLPDQSTTPGHVTSVGTVATTPSGDQGDGSSTPTIDVEVTPDRPGATGRLDQAPVDVSITTASVRNVLVVPVNALLALAGGGYALEVVRASGVHQLVGASVGLFDDADGSVQVSGTGLHPGLHVVVPGS